jgi:hypothetical protein
MKKNVDYKPYIIGGVALLAYFGIVRPVLKKIGIVSTADTKAVQKFEELPAEQNPFNPKYFDYWYQRYRRMLGNEDHFDSYKNLDKLFQNTKIPIKLLLLQQYSDCFGYFYDDEDQIFSYFGINFADKLSVAYFSKFCYERTGKDFFTFLKVGKDVLPSNGLNDAELAKIIRMLKSFPDYYPLSGKAQPPTNPKDF